MLGVFESEPTSRRSSSRFLLRFSLQFPFNVGFDVRSFVSSAEYAERQSVGRLVQCHDSIHGLQTLHCDHFLHRKVLPRQAIQGRIRLLVQGIWSCSARHSLGYWRRVHSAHDVSASSIMSFSFSHAVISLDDFQFVEPNLLLRSEPPGKTCSLCYDHPQKASLGDSSRVHRR